MMTSFQSVVLTIEFLVHKKEVLIPICLNICLVLQIYISINFLFFPPYDKKIDEKNKLER